MTKNPNPNHPLTGKKQTKEHIEKRVQNRYANGTYTLTPKQRQLLSIAQLGKKPWNTGKKLSDEHRKNLSLSHLGLKQTPEHIQKCLNGRLETMKRKGYHFSEEGLKTIIRTHSGKYVSPETRAKQCAAWENELTRNKHIIARSNIVYPFRDSKPERMIQIALALNGIKFEKHKLIKLDKSFHRTDVFIEPNICIEVDGDYFHAHPAKYAPDHVMFTKENENIYAKDIIAKDVILNHKLMNMGYFVIRLWESDIKKNTQTCAQRIVNMIKDRAIMPNRSI
jgi:DNA mismatch endonuclease, patch repair protein